VKEISVLFTNVINVVKKGVKLDEETMFIKRRICKEKFNQEKQFISRTSSELHTIYRFRKNHTTAHILNRGGGGREREREIILFSQMSQNFDMEMKPRNTYKY